MRSGSVSACSSSVILRRTRTSLVCSLAAVFSEARHVLNTKMGTCICHQRRSCPIPLVTDLDLLKDSQRNLERYTSPKTINAGGSWAQDPRRTAGKLAYMYEYQEDYRVFYKYIPRQVVDRCLVVVIYPSQTSASASSIWPRLRRRRASSIPVLRPRDLRPHNGIRRSPAHHLWALLACRLACPLQHRRTRSRQYTLTSLRAQETSASTAMAERRCRLNSLREILYLLDGREDQDIQL